MLPKIVNKVNFGIRKDVNAFVKTQMIALLEHNGINRDANAAALQLTQMNAKIEQFITKKQENKFQLLVKDTGMKTLASANVYPLIARLI